jgi:Zn-dependent metalloprotease
MRNLYLAFLLLTFALNAQAYTIQKDTVLTGVKALEYAKGAVMVRLYDNTAIPAFVKFDEGTNYSKEALIEYLKKWGGWDERFSLKKQGSETDELGIIHERYQQMYLNYPVFGGNYIFHIKNGIVLSMNGLLFSSFQINALDVTENDAFIKAKSYMNATSFKWEIPVEEAHLKIEQHDSTATFFPKTERIIIPAAGDFYKKNNDFRLCYAFDLYAHEPIDRKRVYVDGVTNEVNFHEQLLQHVNTTGVATTAYSGVRTIQTDSMAPTNFRLRETTRGLGCETWNMQKGTNYGAAVDFLDTDNNWNNVNANLDQYATDGHWGLQMTYDYFWLKHNRNSINNAGFKLLNYVHYSTNYTNAFWDGARMTYGDGAAPYTPLVAMDIVAHELTHGLTNFTSNLVYSYESGALNESFSDIFGVAVDFYSRPTLANYLMGDGIGGTPFRSMSNPNLYGDPDTYLGTNWYTGAGDNGGVHINSGVQNFWFYLMVNGGSGTNDLGNTYSVAPLGMDTSGKIAFRNNTVYLFVAAQYADARFYAIQSAADLYGICSEPVKRTTNAWHAVGVGSKWDTTVPVSFTATPVNNCLVPSAHTFINTSNNANFQWFFGDGGTSTAVNPVYTYNAFGSYTVKLVATCGIKKDSLTRTNYINLVGVPPITFTHTPDTSICENSPISLYAKSSSGAPVWRVNGITDTILTITPTASGTYYFSRNNTCQTFVDSIIVTVLKSPQVNTTTVSFPTVCAGNIDTVKATGSLRNDVIVQLGTATTTTATNGNTPYNRTWEGNRSQWIVRASELTGLGVTAGPIKSLQFNVTAAASGTFNQKNFTIKIGHTPQDSMTAAWASITGGFTQVFGPVNISNPSVGWNSHNFNAPFYWNGTSNIIIEVCHDNDINNSCAACYSPNPAIQQSTTAYRAVYSSYSDDAARCGVSGGTTTGYTVNRRPNMRFGVFPRVSNTAGINWNWTPGNLTTANAVVFPTNIPTSTYKVVATTPATTCRDSSTININVVTKPTLVACTDTTICIGSPVNLTATASGTITWNPGALVGPSVSVSPSTTTQYIASVNNGTCTVFDTVIVTVAPIPTLTARNDTSLCAGQSVNLTAVSNIAPIIWNPGALAGSPVSVTPANTSAYIAAVTNVCGTKLDTVNITVIPVPAISTRVDTSICAGASINLTATANITPITWTPGGLVGSPVFVTPGSTTAYIAQVSNVCGISRDTVNVIVIPIPTLVARNDTTICNGANINLTATSNISPITWTPGALVGSPALVSPSTTTDYIATVNNACGIRRDTVKVTVIPIPTITARADTSICAGSSVSLSAIANISPITWNPGSLNGSPVLVTPSATTAYLATVSNGCGTSTDTVNITIIPMPSITARADTTICNGQSLNLTATSNIAPISWNPGALTGSPALVAPSASTAYIASVNNACGNAKDTVNVTVTPIPSISARMDTTMCEGTVLNLFATANISPIIWNPGVLVGDAVNVSPSITTAYVASVSNGCGSKSDTVNVTIIPQPTLSARADTTICKGFPVNLFATTNMPAITWNPGAVIGNNLPFYPNTTTAYIAMVNNVCAAKYDTVIVTVLDKPNLVARDDTTICEGNTATLRSTSNHPVLWNPGALNGFNVVVGPVVTTMYVAESQNVCGISRDTVNINVIEKPMVSARVDSSICIGNGVLLFGYSSLPITWNPGNLSNPALVNPTATTAYVAQVSNACGIGKDTVLITVIPNPTVAASTDTIICPNTNTLLTANGNSLIVWNPGNVSGNNLNINITSSQAYVAKATNACGSKSDTVNVMVLPVPQVTARPDTAICDGGSVYLYATSNINNYNWTPMGSTAAQVLVSPTTKTTYLVSSQNKCGVSIDTVIISVNPQPAVQTFNDTFICKGDSIRLEAKGVGGFKWSNNITDSAIVVKPIITTNYSVTATNICGQAIDFVKVVVNNKPTANASFVKNGKTVNFTNKSTGAVKYKWLFGDGKTDTFENPVHGYTTLGNMTAKLIAYNDCGTDTFSMNYLISGVQAISNGPLFNVHPNPAREYVTIEWKNGTQCKEVKLYNAIGQEVKIEMSVYANKADINTLPLASGVYQLRLVSADHIEVQQIIVEK